MPPSPTGPQFPSTAATIAGANTAWANPNNAKVSDGSYASAAITNLTNPLQVSAFGFNIPSTAIIDGILVEIQCNDPTGSGLFQQAQIMKAGTPAGTDKGNQGLSQSGFAFPTSNAYVSMGGSTDLWGTTWTPADITNSGFGFSLRGITTHGSDTFNVDAVRITVYWHTAPTEIPRQKHYIHKVYDNTGSYIGNLPSVISPYQCAQDINTGGSQITVECAISADTASQISNVLTDESGNILTDESSNNLTDEGTAPLVGTGTSAALIRDGNTVVVWEYSYYHPNGISKFRGVIERTEATYGGDDGDDTVKMVIYSEGSDMDNHLVRGSPYTYTADVTQSSQNTSDTIQSSRGGVNFDGQVFKTGAGVTNIGAIRIMLNGTANVTIDVYDTPALTNHLGSVSQAVSVGTPTDVRFTLATHIKSTGNTNYFFTVSVGFGQSILIYYQNTDIYSNGAMYNYNASGAGGGGWYPTPNGSINTASDLYFVTESTTGSLTATFTSLDPSTSMLETIMNDYNQEGGKVTYTSTSIQATGLSLTYTFNTNTTYEGVKAMLSVSPNGFYYYVDLGTSVLNFKKANTTADIKLTKGKHLNRITIISSIEQVVNTGYVVGGLVSGSNLFTVDQDADSVTRYGQRIDRHIDNRITDTTTAHAVGGSEVSELKAEQYQTTVTVVDKTMDLNLLKPGLIVGFNGFGTYVDNLLAQIVHIDDSTEQAKLILGVLPQRQSVEVEQITRGLVALSTIANPTTPS